MQNQVPDAPWASLDNMQGDEDEGLDIWGFLNRRKSFIIILAIVGAGFGWFSFQRQDRVFQSQAMLQVIHRKPNSMMKGIVADGGLLDAQFEISSASLLQRSIEKHDLKTLPTLRGLELGSAVSKLSGMVRANTAEEAAHIVFISCKGAFPNDTAVIANAVATEYIEHQKSTYENAVTKLQELLREAMDQLTVSIARLESDYVKFELNSPLWDDGTNPHSQRLVGLRSKINDYVIQEAELLAESRQLRTAIAEGKDRNALLMLIGKQVENNQVNVTSVDAKKKQQEISAMTGMYRALLPLLIREAQLSRDLGPGHPDLKRIRADIEMTRQYHEQIIRLQTPDESENAEEASQPKLDFVALYVNSLTEELAVLRNQREELEQIAASEEAGAKKLKDFEHQRQSYQRRIARETSLLEDLQSQMRSTELPSNLGGVSASILTEARHGNLVYPMLSNFLLMGGFLGGFAGLAIGYLVEIADRSFRKPEDIVREFGIPIVGHIPYMQTNKLTLIDNDSAVDSTLVTYHQPRARASESYRSVRTAVCFSLTGRSHKVIQVTSPAAGDGKSTLAQNFAASLAISGKKTIIVESDFRRPRVHKMLGVSRRIGVVDFLNGDVELVDAISETDIENLSVLTCGTRPKNPSELLTGPAYEEMLEVLRQKYDYVIIDTPPVLVVTDPCSVAPRVDGVLLCIRLSRHTRDFGRRALEQLRDVGANMTGIVINGVEESDVYGYGTYNYSDTRYRYRDYSYNYEYKSNESYFNDSEDDLVDTEANTANSQ